jgi:hypothetical protein
MKHYGSLANGSGDCGSGSCPSALPDGCASMQPTLTPSQDTAHYLPDTVSPGPRRGGLSHAFRAGTGKGHVQRPGERSVQAGTAGGEVHKSIDAAAPAREAHRHEREIPGFRVVGGPFLAGSAPKDKFPGSILERVLEPKMIGRIDKAGRVAPSPLLAVARRAQSPRSTMSSHKVDCRCASCAFWGYTSPPVDVRTDIRQRGQRRPG